MECVTECIVTKLVIKNEEDYSSCFSQGPVSSKFVSWQFYHENAFLQEEKLMVLSGGRLRSCE